jgi:hypothetical protein
VSPIVVGIIVALLVISGLPGIFALIGSRRFEGDYPQPPTDEERESFIHQISRKDGCPRARD